MPFNVLPLINTPQRAFYYARNEGKPIPELEPLIATNDWASLFYSHKVLQGRFELGEPTMATSSYYSYQYARLALNDRFELGEPAIATSACRSYRYALHILEGRFPLGEATIAKEPRWATLYNELLVDLLTPISS